MENATEALQMAFGVLVFVIALSISINAFGEARQSIQIILDHRDREYDYTYTQGGNDVERWVRGETLVPSIYKAYKENYKIVFKDHNGQGIELYKKSVASNTTQPQSICYIDLENEVLGNDEQKEKFIEVLLYGYNDENEIKIFTDAGLINLPRKGSQDTLFSKISNNLFKESLGVYYQEEAQGKSNTPNSNKTEKRVITYTMK